MYGMGARSLAQQMGIPLTEAQAFIGEYFRVFGGVRAFLDRTMAEARQLGWVATLLGRRRYLPGLDERAWRRALGDRARGDQHADPGLGRGSHEARDDPRVRFLEGPNPVG
jgi:DNA polymerase I-like protein with 3'-5' exonuclease and polymerase domains